MKKASRTFRIVWIGVILVGLMAGSAMAARVTVKSKIANMRFGPGTDHEVLWQVEQNHPFTVVEKKGKWIKVKDYEGDMAWLHDSLVGKGLTGVITVKSNCNVRSKGTTKGKVLFTVDKGVPFKVVKRKGNWIYIQHADGGKGWIHESLVW